MIMSYYTKIKMSYYKHAIIALTGGYYGRKGYYHNEQEGIQVRPQPRLPRPFGACNDVVRGECSL